MFKKEKYIGFEIHYPADHPQANGKYFGKTPIFEQALKAAQSIGGAHSRRQTHFYFILTRKADA